MKDLLGGKGANDGAVRPPRTPSIYPDQDRSLPQVRRRPRVPRLGLGQSGQFNERYREEDRKNLRFGENLLVSVRSLSVLQFHARNDGYCPLISASTTSPLNFARVADDRRFAFDSFRRFIQMYGNVVHGVNGDAFEEVLEHFKSSLGVKFDNEIPAKTRGGRRPLQRDLQRESRVRFPCRSMAAAPQRRRGSFQKAGAIPGLSPTAGSTRSPIHSGQPSTSSPWSTETLVTTAAQASVSPATSDGTKELHRGISHKCPG